MNRASSATGRRHGAPPVGKRLTRRTVVRTATTVIERDGMGAFSIRRLASELDVRPSALYNHVANLDDLYSAVVGEALADFELSDDPGTWQDWLRVVAVDIRLWLLGRPQTAGLILERAGSTADGPDLLNRVTDRLSAAGVDRTIAHLAWHAVFTVVVGTVQQDLARRVSTDGTFEAVLGLAIRGIEAAAAEPVDPSLRKLVRSHGFSDR